MRVPSCFQFFFVFRWINKCVRIYAYDMRIEVHEKINSLKRKKVDKTNGKKTEEVRETKRQRDRESTSIMSN